MWDKHHQIIKQYQKTLHHFKVLNGKKRPVELRKRQEDFVGFVKTVTRFYRAFIQRLISHFQIKELEWIITKFHLTSIYFPRSPIEPPSSTSIIVCDPKTRDQVIRITHQTLVFLGDLSRYREDHRNPKNWAPAIGYYTLAKKLIPSVGTPYNQFAVIAINEGSTFSATYHWYRAISVAEPHPLASDNLERSFNKIRKAYQSSKRIPDYPRKEEQAVKELLALFVRLHAKCYVSTDSTDYEGLESELLTQLAQDLKDRNLSNGILTKMVFTNIAAQSFSKKRSSPHAPSQSSLNLLRLNVSTFTTLHQVFQPELERAVGELSATSSDVDNLTAIGRRMLPSLRIYSTWLRVNHHTLVNQQPGTAISVMIKQLWQAYANTLSLLAATFGMQGEVRNLGYALEEDDELLGFEPFEAAQVLVKERVNWEEEGGHVHPNEEVLARIRFLLEDGRELCLKEDVPITISPDLTVTYQEDGIITSTPSIGMNSSLNLSVGESASAFMGAKMISEGSLAESVLGQTGVSVVDSVTGSETMRVMNHMVDSLVGPEVEMWDDEVGKGRRRR
ncbi:hypothetical protein FPQ18DRAFT_367418 [Pyronema domesticum]|nr:hypothetical protein FPQ18DRAFT_367418 [Pyronema domesticum]